MASFIENLRQWASNGFDKMLNQENTYHRSSGKTQREYENDIKTLQALETGTKVSAAIDAAGLAAVLGGAAGAKVLGSDAVPMILGNAARGTRGGLLAPGTAALIGGGLGAAGGLAAEKGLEKAAAETPKKEEPKKEEPKKEEPKKEEENPDDFVTFYYVPGDTFGQKILDLGIATDNGLWGDNGDVNYYTKQLIDGGYLDARGNVKLGVPIKLKKRK